MKDIDASSTEDKERVLNMLGQSVLNNLCMRVAVDGAMEKDSPVERFVGELQQKSNLFHAAAGA